MKSVLSVSVCVLVMGFLPAIATAQSVSSSTTRSTSTTTQDGATTRTVTRSTTTGVSASVDGEALGEALAGALIDRLDPNEARLRRLAEPARTDDAFGEWEVTDGGRDAIDCRFVMGERAGFLGVRRAEPIGDCPGRIARNSRWRVQGGVLIFYTSVGEELRRLRYVEGRFVGGGLELTRPVRAQTAEGVPEAVTTADGNGGK